MGDGVISNFEVMAMSDREGWVCVVRRYIDADGHEYIPTVAEFAEEHARFADEMAAQLNTRNS